MLASGGLVAFIGVIDLRRARQFYREVLGLPLRDESPFALVADVNGTMLRVTAVSRPVAARGRPISSPSSGTPFKIGWTVSEGGCGREPSTWSAGKGAAMLTATHILLQLEWSIGLGRHDLVGGVVDPQPSRPRRAERALLTADGPPPLRRRRTRHT